MDALYLERRAIFRWMLDAGVRQATIARRAGITPMAVTLAVRVEEKQAG